MPSVSVAQRHKVNRDPIEDAHIILLEFQEDGDPNVHRAAINNEDITHQGEIFYQSYIEINLPGSGDQQPGVELKMSNITRVIGRAINRAKNLIGCRIRLIDSSIPDETIVDTYNLFVLRKSSGDSVLITADLGPRAEFDEPVPFRRTSRLFFPGVWFKP